MTAARVCISGLLVAASISACTTETDGQALGATSSGAQPTQSSISATAPSPSIPHDPPNKNTDGTAFDPCAAFAPDDLRGVGIDPATVKAADSRLSRGCKWYGSGWRVQVVVINGTIDRYLNQDLYPGSQPVTIEGLGGAIHRDEPGNMRNCFVELPSQQATVATIVEVSDPPALQDIPDACTKAVEVATVTAKKLPK